MHFEIGRDALLFSNRAKNETTEKLEWLDMLSKSCGVGLWDAIFVNGDPMHPGSRWTWSPQLRNLVGFTTEQEFPNVATSWSDRLHPDDVAPTFERFTASLKSGNGYELVYRLKVRDGSYRWFKATVGVALGPDGVARRACGSLVDIHEATQASEERRRLRQELAGRFETAIGGLVEGVSSSAEKLQAISGKMSETAEETSRRSVTVSAASEQATQNVNTVAAATEELSASVRAISQQVGYSTQMSGEAVAQAKATNEQIQGLAVAVEKIGAVVKLINDIASQTNLLALNATIEAARAGDAGKGFAVVASEVKALAGQTAKATEEISAQITNIQDATTASVRSIQTIAGTIAKVNEIAGEIASAVHEQGEAAREIAHNVTEAAKGTAEVTVNISGVSAAAQVTGVTAAEMLSSSAELTRNGELLKAQVHKFLTDVRAA